MFFEKCVCHRQPFTFRKTHFKKVIDPCSKFSILLHPTFPDQYHVALFLFFFFFSNFLGGFWCRVCEGALCDRMLSVRSCLVNGFVSTYLAMQGARMPQSWLPTHLTDKQCHSRHMSNVRGGTLDRNIRSPPPPPPCPTFLPSMPKGRAHLAIL